MLLNGFIGFYRVSSNASLSVQTRCQEMRKKKDLELQILTEPIRNWEGDDIKTLGPILHMSQTTVHTPTCQVSHYTLTGCLCHIVSLLQKPHEFKGCQFLNSTFVLQKLNECYLVLFPHTLLMLSASPRMSGFIYQVPQLKLCCIYVLHQRVMNNCTDSSFFCSIEKFSSVFLFVFLQGRMSLSGMLISLIEDGETLRNAFEISGALFTQATVHLVNPCYFRALLYQCVPKRYGDEVGSLLSLLCASTVILDFLLCR